MSCVVVRTKGGWVIPDMIVEVAKDLLDHSGEADVDSYDERIALVACRLAWLIQSRQLRLPSGRSTKQTVSI